MKSPFLFIAILLCVACIAQPGPALQRAIAELEKDPQFTHALIGLHVTDRSGKTIIEKNADIGMAPASTLKIVTSISSFELLGKGFQFKTGVATDGDSKNGTIAGNLYLIGGSDPTLGSSRWAATRAEKIFEKIRNILSDNKITKITGGIVIDERAFLYSPIPTGWIWEDVGNYYGAGAWGLNWLENKYALNLASTSEVGKPTRIVSTSPAAIAKQITNHILSAARGSGDNAYLFSAPYSDRIFATGTIPAGSDNFTIYGAMPEPGKFFLSDLNLALQDIVQTASLPDAPLPVAELKILGTVYSPPLDSVNYWFLKESVNLFGEAMLKNLVLQQGKKATTEAGVNIIRDFWAGNGIAKGALKIMDGSGLSPANRITPKALVQMLNFAKQKTWFSSFHFALPELNGIKMKSGYIGGVRSYSGYVKSKSGEEYTFAFIINNFDGAPSTVREKMYKVLNLLK